MYIRGYSVVTIIIVLVMVGVVASIAIPSYQNYVLRTHRVLAVEALDELAKRQQRFHAEHQAYADRLTRLGGPGDPSWLDRLGTLRPTETADALYRIDLELDPSDGFRIRARPLGRQLADTRCRTLTVIADGVRQASGSDGAGCWPRT